MTPLHDEWAEFEGVARSYLDKEGVLKYQRFDYYTPEILIAFIGDIVDTVKNLELETGRKIRIHLKPKRERHVKNDSTYLDLISNLSKNSRGIRIIKPDENMYKMISESNLSIVIPYSSPAYVADSLGVPSIYFDPTKKLIPGYEETDNILFASGKNDLHNKIFKILNS